MSRRDRGSLLALVLELASRPEGVSRADLAQHIVMTSNCPYLTNYRNRGYIVGVNKPGVTWMRYFSTQQAADAWLAIPVEPKPATVKPIKTPKPPKVKLTAEELRAIRIHAAKVRASKMSPPPLGKRTPKPHQNITFNPPTIDDTRLRPSGEPIITADTRVTLDTADRPTARWQMLRLPADPRYPSFSSAPLGVDPDTGRAWGAQA